MRILDYGFEGVGTRLDAGLALALACAGRCVTFAKEAKIGSRLIQGSLYASSRRRRCLETGSFIYGVYRSSTLEGETLGTCKL